MFYNPENYLTPAILAEVLSESFGLESFEIIEESIINGEAIARIGECYFLFSEGFESDMDFYISSSYPPANNFFFDGTKVLHCIYIPLKGNNDLTNLKNAQIVFPFASKEKVYFELREIVELIKEYLMPCIEGDFSALNAFVQSHGEEKLFYL